MFKEAGVDVELVVSPCALGACEEDLISAIGDADAVITQTTFHTFNRQVLSSLPKCRLIASVGVGYDSLDVEAATECGILTTNVPDASIREVSDHTMALILACTRRIVHLNDIVKSGRWTAVGDPYISGEVWPKLSSLEGQTLGLVSFGRIPRAVVPKARAFGLRVVAYDPHVSTDVFREYDVEQVDFDRLLAESDIVSVHAPLTKETEGLLGLEQFKKMKPTACLINTGRGAVVDQEALHTALAEGCIAMAAVDVTEPEPIPPDSPLLKLDNFVVTAHSAGISPPAFDELRRRPAVEVIRFARGEWPAGLLDHAAKDKYVQKWGKL
jgi:D-3-phosphoglycerate dehydrogenase